MICGLSHRFYSTYYEKLRLAYLFLIFLKILKMDGELLILLLVFLVCLLIRLLNIKLNSIFQNLMTFYEFQKIFFENLKTFFQNLKFFFFLHLFMFNLSEFLKIFVLTFQFCLYFITHKLLQCLDGQFYFSINLIQMFLKIKQFLKIYSNSSYPVTES